MLSPLLCFVLELNYNNDFINVLFFAIGKLLDVKTLVYSTYDIIRIKMGKHDNR